MVDQFVSRHGLPSCFEHLDMDFSSAYLFRGEPGIFAQPQRLRSEWQLSALMHSV